ncbi:MAG: sugar transferase [Rubrivivax sp.]|nr:sugar transferase [Rubrivivax sp.]
MAKRLFDVVIAFAGLFVFGLLMLAIAIWIRMDSAGPVLFRQQRVGRGGRLFKIHKFRTMAADAPALGPAISVDRDPRITKAGAWLRRSKLDELPQLFDVLLGDMSIVGPRPEVPQYVALYPAALRDQVLSVRPGITDPVSLEFADEGERLAAAADPEREYCEVILPTKLKAAAAYAQQATVLSDLHVVWRTMTLLWRR